MSEVHRPEVAVLLATYNGERYIAHQVRSLVNNQVAFTLHWLDDQSTDDTRQLVRDVAHRSGISLREWHQPQHQGLPAAFFQLLECVEADIYLFCDQDDIWQPGKVDATVRALLPDLGSPSICFSDPLAFKRDPERHYPTLQLQGARTKIALEDSRIFMSLVGYGNTQGFTRALRDIYMRHTDIARCYAFGHDVWMYGIGVASGMVRFLPDAPTTLYRWHDTNFSVGYAAWVGTGSGRIVTTRKHHQLLRRAVSRHAEGFILAAPTLPQTPKLAQLLAISRRVALIRARQSPAALIRLFRLRAMWPSTRMALGLAGACLFSDATTASRG